MTDTAPASEPPNVLETARFLRRFADLMSNGQNAAFLLNAAVLLETMAARIGASTGEEQLWRHKAENLARDNDRLEAECDALRGDVDGHLELARSLLNERETISETLQGREAELAELGEAVERERAQLVAAAQSHAQALASQSGEFDREREAHKSMMAVRDEELVRLRAMLDSEREQSAQQQQAQDVKLAELQLAAEREREDLQSRIASNESLIAVLRSDAERDSEWMKARIAQLEEQRVELRAALDRAGEAPAQAASPERSAPVHAIAATQPAPGDGNAIVPIATLRHARAQFEYLAKESIQRGDVATQVMCELSAHTLERVLDEAARAERTSAAGQIALSILEP